MKKTTADYWAPRINAEWRKSVEGILNVGRQLIAAKEACEHGEFLRLFKGGDDVVGEPLPFTVNTAERIMAVARHPVLSKSAHVQSLPQSWGTLYELTKVPEVDLAEAIATGKITPEITRGQAAELRADPIEKPQRELCVIVSEAFRMVYAKYAARLDGSSREYVIERLRSMVHLLEQEQEQSVATGKKVARAGWSDSIDEQAAVELFDAISAAIRGDCLNADSNEALHDHWLQLGEPLFSDFPLCRVRAPWSTKRVADTLRDAAAYAVGVQGRPAKVFRQLNVVARRVVRKLVQQSTSRCPS